LEFRSFSKNGGFTGGTLRVSRFLPKELLATTPIGGKTKPLHLSLWHRRFSTKFNSVSYPVNAVQNRSIQKPVRETDPKPLIDHYSGLMRGSWLHRLPGKTGLTVYGGASNAPYIWVKGPVRIRQLGRCFRQRFLPKISRWSSLPGPGFVRRRFREEGLLQSICLQFRREKNAEKP